MAETKPTATKAKSAQAKQDNNMISWLAPVVCII
jgi:hypothetical protein